MDFIRHYRPRNNVVERPTENGGQRIMLTGHHELMFPLLAAAIREELAGASSKPRTQEALMPPRCLVAKSPAQKPHQSRCSPISAIAIIMRV